MLKSTDFSINGLDVLKLGYRNCMKYAINNDFSMVL